MADDLFETILPSCYINGIGPLPVLDAETSGGQSGAVHKSWRRRGARIEHTGLDEYDGTFTLGLYNDLFGYQRNLFPDLYYDLLVSLEDNGLSTIVHPTKGEFQALLKWKETLDADKRNGVALQISWKEHNASAGKILGTDDNAVAVPASTNSVLEKAKTADIEAVKVSRTYKPIATDLDAALAKLDTGDVLTTPQIDGVFGECATLVMSALGDIGLDTALGHDAVIALEDTQSLLARLRSQYLGNKGKQRTYIVRSEMSLWEVAFDAESTSELVARANAINDPLAIPAGTILVIP